MKLLVHSIVACLLIAFFCQDCLAERKKRILVLHSYHQGLEWTDNISRGVESVFSPLSELYEIHYEYLDTKRNSGQAYIDELVHFITIKHSTLNYSAIIVSDNNGLKLLNSGRIHFTGNPPVIFCGINNYTDALTSNIDKVLGVLEAADHRATFDLMRRLHPDRKHVTIVLDHTSTGNALRKELEVIEPEYQGRLEFNYLRDFSIAELPETLARLGDTDLIYLLTLNRDRDNNFISYAEGVQLLNKSATVPIYGAWDFYLGKGIIGGRIISGYLQGQEAASLALKLLNGYRIDEMEPLHDSPTQYMFDYHYLEKFGVSLSSLPVNSRVINKPLAPFERYKSLMLGITASSFIIAMFLLWHAITQQERIKAEQKYALELEQKVSERTRELEAANKELQRISIIDGLTQLYNRRYFDETLEAEIRRLQRTASPLSLLICDIDHFKKYNDAYGHLAGDQCIGEVVESIREFCNRASDIPARFGGEEFAIILPNIESEGAMTVAERIRQDVASKKIPHEYALNKDIVSISIGVTTVIPTTQTLSKDIISLADEALYESKNNGRDQVTLKAG